MKLESKTIEKRRNLRFICPICRAKLVIEADKLLCSKNRHVFDIDEGIYCLLPPSIAEITTNDAAYHSTQKEIWVELNQINTLRNLYFHRRIIEKISTRSSEERNILELGGGAGFDLKLFLRKEPLFCNYLFSEISKDMATFVRRGVDNPSIFYCCIDTQRIPLDDDQFDFVYTVAALHHLPDVLAGLEEIVRVTKTGGFIILGIEPNKLWLQLLSKVKPHIRRMTPQKSHSPADDEAVGFCIKDFKKFAELYHLRLVEIEPVWFFCGFIHYGFEFIYRFFRLRKRIQLPPLVEMMFISLDTLLSFIPGSKNLFCHFSVTYQKRE